MILSVPIYHLKRQARRMSRAERIPLHEALDRIAAAEGFGSWSLLVAKAADAAPAAKLFPRLAPGDMVLLGARPGQGKTLMSLELAVEAMKAGRPAFFFTLDYTEDDVRDRFEALGVDVVRFGGLFEVDSSDEISSGYIIRRLATAPRGTLVVVDYLQLLDQKREHPPLGGQVRALKSFAREKALTMVFLSQIDRAYETSGRPWPDIGDVRLPNPVDLTLFDRTCFLHRGEVRFRAAG